jgi:hypothetical protein
MLIEKRFSYQMRDEVREVNRSRRAFIHEFHSAWIIVVVCLLACTFVISKPVQADIELPPTDYKVVSLSDEQSNDRWEMGHHINCYAGGGVEPMLDIMAWVTDYTGDQQPAKSAGYTFQWDHKIMPLGALPEGFTGEVPYKFDVRIEGDIKLQPDGYFSEVRAAVNGVGAVFLNPFSSPITYSGSFTGTAAPGTILQTILSASLYIIVSNRMTTEAQIIVDPYIYIDPAWEYASYFGVFQTPGPNDNGVWQRVNRDWMCECDLEPDGDVDGTDLYSFIQDFGRTNCGEGCLGDLNGDGKVDADDLVLFAGDFGKVNCK